LHSVTMLISVCSFLSCLSLCLNCLSSLSLLFSLYPYSSLIYLYSLSVSSLSLTFIFISSWIAHPFELGPIGCPETSVSNYKSTLCNLPEEQRSYPYLFFFALDFSCICSFLFSVFPLSLTFLILFS